MLLYINISQKYFLFYYSFTVCSVLKSEDRTLKSGRIGIIPKFQKLLLIITSIKILALIPLILVFIIFFH